MVIQKVHNRSYASIMLREAITKDIGVGVSIAFVMYHSKMRKEQGVEDLIELEFCTFPNRFLISVILSYSLLLYCIKLHYAHK